MERSGGRRLRGVDGGRMRGCINILIAWDGRTDARSHARTHARTHASARSCTHKHTDTDTCIHTITNKVAFCASHVCRLSCLFLLFPLMRSPTKAKSLSLPLSRALPNLFVSLFPLPGANEIFSPYHTHMHARPRARTHTYNARTHCDCVCDCVCVCVCVCV